MKRIALLLFVALMYCGSTAYAQYYVSPSGSDGNSGTSSSKPLRTLGKALQKVSNGGSITLAAGTYREGDLLVTNNDITIKGAGAGKTIIAGSDKVTGWEKHSGDIWKKTGWKTNSQQLFVDGKPLQQRGNRCGWNVTHAAIGGAMILSIVGSNSSTSLTPGSFYYDPGSDVLYCMLKDRSSPNNHYMEASVKDEILNGGNTTNVTIQNLSIRHTTSTRNRVAVGMLTTGYSGWKIEDCSFEYGDFCGVLMRGNNHKIRRSSFTHNGSNGITVNGSIWYSNWKYDEDRPHMNSLIENCTIEDNNYRNFSTAWHSGGIKSTNGVRGLTISKNYVRDNNGIGVWFDDCFGDNVVEYNILSNNRHGVAYEIGHSFGGDDYSVKVVDNRIYNNDLKGVYISASASAIVEYNTFYNNEQDIVLHGMPRGGNELKNNKVRYNILDAHNNSKGAHIIIYQGSKSSNNSTNNNFYRSPSSSVRVGIETSGSYAITHKDLKTLCNQKGHECSGKTGNPQWKNASSGDFGLSSSSPAKGKGWRGGGPDSSPSSPDTTPNDEKDDSPAAPTPTNGQIAINAGGGQYTDSKGVTYMADKYYGRGSTVNYSSLSIGNTSDDKLYQTQRIGWFTYSIPVKNGSYKLTIKTAELKYKSNGQRRFDVHVEGKELFQDVDLHKLGGYANAVDLEKTVEVKDGVMNVTFDIDYRECRVSALVITPTSGSEGDRTSAPGGLVKALNCGASFGLTDSRGISFEKDNSAYYKGGSQRRATTYNIKNTSDNSLYQYERFGADFSYGVSVPNGDYTVTMEFSENWFTSRNERLFDVEMEGKLVINDLDIYAKAGYRTAYTVTKTVRVNDGHLKIRFKSRRQAAVVSGIVIQKANSGAATDLVTTESTLQTVATDMQVYPNPFNDQVRLRFEASMPASTVRVFTSTGQLMETQSIPEGQVEWEMNTAHLPVGAYMISVETPGKAPQQRMVIKQ
ncbi:Por secretion system C-terminal sorting domain-containing protein [Catalinimonas alkaloidigena]|uniref:Por secretion system C-terminal sorting domain-containing protein n=1 Tax=Catalinimonas alkaloidigena TaxID=1075417 RepID=A0A1G9LIM5_9BACT|nr:malectin domain-containing carbohydrate-binding protein [Catalinimonas alkaloidigena]SDL61792.1 Por secretion system C-terminal sorting domain-containing protein [Catalinimonas alkaloidigena]